jgi:hypothetical protein
MTVSCCQTLVLDHFCMRCSQAICKKCTRIDYHCEECAAILCGVCSDQFRLCASCSEKQRCSVCSSLLTPPTSPQAQTVKCDRCGSELCQSCSDCLSPKLCDDPLCGNITGIFCERCVIKRGYCHDCVGLKHCHDCGRHMSDSKWKRYKRCYQCFTRGKHRCPCGYWISTEYQLCSRCAAQ